MVKERWRTARTRHQPVGPREHLEGVTIAAFIKDPQRDRDRHYGPQLVTGAAAGLFHGFPDIARDAGIVVRVSRRPAEYVVRRAYLIHDRKLNIPENWRGQLRRLGHLV